MNQRRNLKIFLKYFELGENKNIIIKIHRKQWKQHIESNL